MNRPRIGIPYGRALVTADGKSAVQCPLCPAILTESQGAREGARDYSELEDAMTKSASAAYAEHYQRLHECGRCHEQLDAEPAEILDPADESGRTTLLVHATCMLPGEGIA